MKKRFIQGHGSRRRTLSPKHRAAIASGLTKDPLSRVMSKVRKSPSGCWEWTAATNGLGYGRVWFEGRLQPAHRVVVTLLRGSIPEGLELDHLCRNRSCVNPAHLEAVTHAVNTLRGDAPAARYARRDKCSKGHPFTPENTATYPAGGRRCKQCHRERERARKQRHLDHSA